ncbi:peptide methionine sulfoxide reductase [Halobacteriales archaeon SW_12_71_31]|nr:MAG: peptide methionine sulfoxide reductase [Halobacteriales archaeon SW_12_71_31]
MLTPAVVEEYDEAAPSPAATETAAFGLGCFWGPDAQFGALDGVVRTRVGYAGGTTPEPTYRDLGDHTEVVQVDYDPGVVSYRELVGLALRSHDLDRQPGARQYQHVVLTTGDQRAVVDEVLAERGRDAAGVATRVEPLSSFTVAEPYHQKHALRSGGVPDAFEGYDDRRLRESPAAATLNGHARGHDLPDDDLSAALGRAGR